jgi:ferredoxin-NADP reductase
VKAEIVSHLSIAEDVVEVRLSPADGEMFPRYTAGAHLDVMLPGHGPRQYSLCGDGEEYVFCVQREHSGRGGSKYLHEHAKVGDLLEISEPRNSFPLVSDEPVLLIAGGIGVTPFFSMLQELAGQDRRFFLLYFARSLTRVVYPALVETLVQKGLCSLGIGLDPQVTAESVSEKIAAVASGTHIYVCGPAGLNRLVEETCATRQDLCFHSESFNPQSASLSDDPERPFHIVLKKSGRKILVDPSMTILEALRGADIEVPSSCESGLCGTCRVDYTSGVVDHRDFVLSQDEQKFSLIACCSRAFSEEIELNL